MSGEERIKELEDWGGIDPFERFAQSYFNQDPGEQFRKIKKLRQERVLLMEKKPEAEKKVKGKKGTGTTRGKKAKQEPSLAALKKALGKVSKKDLEKLALLVKLQK